MAKKIKWRLIEVRAGDLKPNPFNPKKRDEAGYERLKKSAEKFGLVFSGIVNKDLAIIDGHSRNELADPNEMVSVFAPSRQLTEKEYKEMNAIYDIARAGEVDVQILEEQFTDEFFDEWDIKKESITPDGLGDNFELATGDRSPYQQMTFVVHTDMAELIKNAISNLKMTDEFKNYDFMGNESANGNALYLITKQWGEQRK